MGFGASIGVTNVHGNSLQKETAGTEAPAAVSLVGTPKVAEFLLIDSGEVDFARVDPKLRQTEGDAGKMHQILRIASSMLAVLVVYRQWYYPRMTSAILIAPPPATS